jgi:hypothetical protein
LQPVFTKRFNWDKKQLFIAEYPPVINHANGRSLIYELTLNDVATILLAFGMRWLLVAKLSALRENS